MNHVQYSELRMDIKSVRGFQFEFCELEIVNIVLSIASCSIKITRSWCSQGVRLFVNNTLKTISSPN